MVGVKRGNSRYFDEVTLEVVESSRGIMVCAMFKNADMECDEDGYHVHNDRRRGWRDRDDRYDLSIDIVVKVPKDLLVSANSVSGDVSVIDIVANKPVGTIALGGKPWGIVAAP